MGLDPRFIERITVPWARFESIPIYVQGSNRYYHSVNDHDPISMSFYVDVNMTAVKALLAWSNKVYKDGRYGLPADYKKVFGAEILDTASDNAVAIFLAEGAWPSSIDDMEFSYNESGRLIVTASITVDQVTFIEGAAAGTGSETSGSLSYEDAVNGNNSANVGGIESPDFGSGSSDDSGIEKGYSV